MSTERLDLDIDESNELQFKVQVEGTEIAPARVRLVCEGEDISYVFKGFGTEEPGIVQFDIPKMTGKLKEGVYQSSVEVLIDNRYFIPSKFEINFKQPIKVTVEHASVPQVKKKETTVSAVPIIVEKRAKQPHVQIQQHENRQQKQKPIKSTTVQVLDEKVKSKLAQRREERIRGTRNNSLDTLFEDFARTTLDK